MDDGVTHIVVHFGGLQLFNVVEKDSFTNAFDFTLHHSVDTLLDLLRDLLVLDLVPVSLGLCELALVLINDCIVLVLNFALVDLFCVAFFDGFNFGLVFVDLVLELVQIILELVVLTLCLSKAFVSIGNELAQLLMFLVDFYNLLFKSLLIYFFLTLFLHTVNKYNII